MKVGQTWGAGLVGVTGELRTCRTGPAVQPQPRRGPQGPRALQAARTHRGPQPTGDCLGFPRFVLREKRVLVLTHRGPRGG